MREGGGAVQRLGFSWCTGGARRITAVTGRTGEGGASDRRREMTPGVGQAGPNGLMTQVGKENSRKKINGPPGNFEPNWKWASFGGNKENRKRAAQGMWAKIIMGCRKILFELFSRILIQNKEF
jgi:hypothetical protein